MREFFTEILADLPEAVLTAAGVLVFLAGAIAVLIVVAIPVPV